MLYILGSLASAGEPEVTWSGCEVAVRFQADPVEQECSPRDVEALLGYFELLEKMELIRVHR